MVAADELPIDGPPLADEAAASGADRASSSFLDLLMDEDDVPPAAQLSQAQIIESQARTLADLTRKVEAGDEYRRLTKSKLKEAAARLREYRLRVEELTTALDKAKQQKPAAAKAKAPLPMRDAVTQTLPPARRDMMTQTLQAIQPPVVHCSTQTIEATEKQDAVVEKKIVLVHAAVQTLPQSTQSPSVAHSGTQTLDSTPKQDESKAVLVHDEVQTLSQSMQSAVAHCGTQTLDFEDEQKAELVRSGVQMQSPSIQRLSVAHYGTQTPDTVEKHDVVIETMPELVDPNVQRGQTTQISESHSGRPTYDTPQKHDVVCKENTELVSSSVQRLSKPVQIDSAIANAIDAELELMSSDSDEEDEDAKDVPVDNDSLAVKTKPVASMDVINTAIYDELASSSEDDQDIEDDGKDAFVDKDAAILKITPTVSVDAVSAAIDDELASSSEDDVDMAIDEDRKGASDVEDIPTLKITPAASVDAVSAAIEDELVSSSEDDMDVDMDEDNIGAPTVEGAAILKKIPASLKVASVDAVSAAIDDELASSSEDDGDDATPTLEKMAVSSVDAVSAAIDDELASSPEDDGNDAPTLRKISVASVDAVSAAIDDELASSSEDDVDMDVGKEIDGGFTLKKMSALSADAVCAAIDDKLANSSKAGLYVEIHGDGKVASISNDTPRIRADFVDNVIAIESTTVRTQATEPENRTKVFIRNGGVAAKTLPGLQKIHEHVHLSIRNSSSEPQKASSSADSENRAGVHAKTTSQRFAAAMLSAIHEELDFGSNNCDENGEDGKDSESPQSKQIIKAPVDAISAAIEDELASSSDEKELEAVSKPVKNIITKHQTAKTQLSTAIDTIPPISTGEEAEAIDKVNARRSDHENDLQSSFRPNLQKQVLSIFEDGDTAKANKITTATDNELASSSSDGNDVNPTRSDQMMDNSDSTSPSHPLPTESTSIWAQVMKPSMAPDNSSTAVSRNGNPLGNLSNSTSDSSSDSSDSSSDSEAEQDQNDTERTPLMPLHPKPANRDANTHSDTKVTPQAVSLDQVYLTEKPLPCLPPEPVKVSIQNESIVGSAPRKRSMSSTSIIEEVGSPTKKQKLPEKPLARSSIPVLPGTGSQKATTAIDMSQAQRIAPTKQLNPELVQSVDEPAVNFAKAFQKLISRQEHEKGDHHYVVRTITALKKSSFKAEPAYVAKLCRVLADEYLSRRITPIIMVNGALRAFLAMRKGYSLNIDEPSSLSGMCLQVLLRLMRTTNRLHESMITEKRITLLECLSVLHHALWTSTGSTTALDSFTSSSKLSGATQVGFQHDPKAIKHYVYLAYTCAFFSRLCITLDSPERVHVLAFDILKHSPTILGLYLVRTIMTVVPQFLRMPLTFIQECIEHAMTLVANQSANERELIGDESSMMILSSVASIISRDALSAAIEEDPRRAQKAFVNRIWMQEIDELLSCDTTMTESEYIQRSFELGKCTELLAVVYDLDFVTRSFSVERFQTLFNECEAANGNGRILLVQLAGNIATVVAAKRPDDASVAYVDTVGGWMQQLLRSPNENEPKNLQLQLACVSVCVDLVLALASAKSVVGIWWWSALHWAEQQPTETLWTFPAEFLRRFRLAVFATSKANEIKSEK